MEPSYNILTKPNFLEKEQNDCYPYYIKQHSKEIYSSVSLNSSSSSSSSDGSLQSSPNRLPLKYHISPRGYVHDIVDLAEFVEESSPLSSDKKLETHEINVDSLTSASSSTSLPYPKLPNNVCPTTCSVCGDRATGYHYEVPSCNGCKTFFRRTVLAQKQHICVKGGKCFENPSKERRCTCKACRFRKCVDVGMNPLAIQQSGDVSHTEFFNEITKKRKTSKGQLSEEPPLQIARTGRSLSFLEDETERMISQLMYLELKSEQFRYCKYNPSPFALPNLIELINKENQFPLADRLGPMPNWPLLDQDDFKKYDSDGKVVFNPVPERKHWLIFDLITSVEYAKTFSFFHQLSDSDKISLLRATVLLCFNLTQAFYSFQQKSCNLIYPDGTTLRRPPPPSPTWADVEERKAKDAHNFGLIEQMKRKSIEMLIQKNYTKTEYVLLRNIILCNPAAVLSEKGSTLLAKERERVTKALFNHCMAAFGSAGPGRFAANIAMINAFEEHAQFMKDFHLIMKVMHVKSPFHEISLIEDIMKT